MRETVSIKRKDGRGGKRPAFLVVGHGTRDARGVEEFHELIGLVRERNPGLAVEGGFIELSRPPISECVNRLAEGGARNVAAGAPIPPAPGHPQNNTPAPPVRAG